MILVVEDDADLLHSTSRLLERAGYAVGQAATGEEALRAMQDHRPDLVLLDRDLPGIDGLEVCRRIKQDPALQDTFVVILSGVYVECDEQAEGLESGADGYISRPIANRELLARVKAYARIHQLTSSLREDVAQRKSLWEFAVEGTGLGIVDWDIGSGEVSFSDHWLSLLGYSRDQLSPRLESLMGLVHPDDLQVVLAGRKSASAIEHRLKHKQGHWLWIQSRSLVFKWSEGGEPLRVIFTQLDISERKRAEEELLQARKEASLGAMAGGIAHHFNNLLTTIQGNLEMALEEAGPPIDEMLVDALDATRQAAAVSGSMLGYLGQGVRHPEPYDLERMLTEMLPVLRTAVPVNIGLELDLAAAPCWTTIDPAEFRQLVFSLVTNGWEAVAEQGGVVRLGARRVGPWACLEVRDNGHGMDGETRERMFDPFFSTKFTGRGMGLSVTLGIVRAYGGSIEVDSAFGRGTMVRVFLPQCRPACAGKVMVVDDDAQVLSTYRRILGTLGREMILARTGQEAIELFEAQADSIGCVLLDLSMPGMDGWQVLSALRRLCPNIYVVVVSGLDVAQLRSESREVQPDDWLQKPFDVKELAALLGQSS